MKEPISFIDPSSYPFVFKPRKQEVFIYGQGVYPVSFKFRPNPRQANIVAFALDERDILMLDRDIGNDASVCTFSKDTSHRIELYAESKDIQTSPFHIKVWPAGGSPSILKEGQVSHIKQPSTLSNIYHIFSMEPSTKLFNPVSGLYPTVSLKLYFSPTLRNDESIWDTLTLPDKQETMVLMHPSGAYGILDILAELKVNWYKNSDRTIPYYNLPPVVRNEKFGIRFYISNPSLFTKKAIINENGSVIVEDLLTQESLDKMGYNPADVMYFGNGIKPGDLFFGKEKGIEVDLSGLPIQSGNIVLSYLLDNELSDLDFSSYSSISSLDSSTLSISSSSVSSLSSVSSVSSISSSSRSSESSESSSRSSESSESSESSKSSDSSTEILPQYVCVSGASLGVINGTYVYSNDNLYCQVPSCFYEIYRKLNGTWWFDGVYSPDNNYYNSTTSSRSPSGLTYQTNSPDLGTSPTISEGQCP